MNTELSKSVNASNLAIRGSNDRHSKSIRTSEEADMNEVINGKVNIITRTVNILAYN